MAADDVDAVTRWTDNAALIADVARLGPRKEPYLHGHVLDLTYGEGNFWTRWRPERLTTNDKFKPAQHAHDFRDTPWPNCAFDVVVLDPPYKLNGTPAMGEMDRRFGTAHDMKRDEVLALLLRGALEAFRLCRVYALVKCQDQVEGGLKRWQTDMVVRALEAHGAQKVDRFDFVYTPIPQPAEKQVRSRSNASQLLVFRKPPRMRKGHTTEAML